MEGSANMNMYIVEKLVIQKANMESKDIITLGGLTNKRLQQFCNVYRCNIKFISSTRVLIEIIFAKPTLKMWFQMPHLLEMF